MVNNKQTSNWQDRHLGTGKLVKTCNMIKIHYANSAPKWQHWAPLCGNSIVSPWRLPLKFLCSRAVSLRLVAEEVFKVPQNSLLFLLQEMIRELHLWKTNSLLTDFLLVITHSPLSVSGVWNKGAAKLLPCAKGVKQNILLHAHTCWVCKISLQLLFWGKYIYSCLQGPWWPGLVWSDEDWLGSERSADKRRHGLGAGSYVQREAHWDLTVSRQRQPPHPNPGE